MTVDAKAVLQNLETSRPLFEELPVLRPTRIFGLESELEGPEHYSGRKYKGMPGPKTYMDLEDQKNHRWYPNGGKVYLDMIGSGAPVFEYCTPETGNPLEAVVYARAMRRIVARDFQGDGKWRWYDTTVPYLLDTSNSLGNHESYSADASKIRTGRDLLELAPFLVARVVFTGSGHVNGKGEFELSPRARFIAQAASVNTMNNRPLINTREFKSEGRNRDLDDRYERLHLIYGESNPNQINLFLKLASTALAIEMLEMGELPYIECDHMKVAGDLRKLSLSSSRWLDEGVPKTSESWDLTMSSIREGPDSALDLLDMYLGRMYKLFPGRDVVTDTFLVIMKDTLDRLRYPQANFKIFSRRLDAWAKLNLFDACWTPDDEKFEAWKGRCRDLDLEYHRLGSGGLVGYLEGAGYASRLVSAKMIRQAMSAPPSSTRASFRGILIGKLAKKSGNEKFSIELNDHTRWDEFTIVDRYTHIPHAFGMPDPFNTYEDQKGRVRKLLG